MDPATLTYLLSGGHLGMKERMDRGLWPHPPLKYDDVLTHLAAMLEASEWFPYPREPHIPGNAVDEWIVVERRSSRDYWCHWQRHYAWDPFTVAESAITRFSLPEEAARASNDHV